MPLPKLPPEFDSLSTIEKIEYVQQLWDLIADEAHSVELTEPQHRELIRRREAYSKGSLELSSWDDVRRSLRKDK